MNFYMSEKLEKGECLDVRKIGKEIDIYRETSPECVDDGCVFQLDKFVEGKDYCDAAEERWIWSIGQCELTGKILAATDARFYDLEGFQCLWLR